MEIKFVKIHEKAMIPTYAHQGDAGMDVYAVETLDIQPGERKLVHTGLKVEMPEDLELQVRPRSGLALKQGITVLNTPGTVDAGYRGEIGVILINLGQNIFHINPGDRIAQFVFNRYERVTAIEVDTLSSSERGEGGYGSSGGHQSL